MQIIVIMDKTRKHLISLAVFTAISTVVPATTFAQLHLEIAKAPEQAPKIAIVPFTNDKPMMDRYVKAKANNFTGVISNVDYSCSLS